MIRLLIRPADVERAWVVVVIHLARHRATRPPGQHAEQQQAERACQGT
jgi:hypothetical protein